MYNSASGAPRRAEIRKPAGSTSHLLFRPRGAFVIGQICRELDLGRGSALVRAPQRTRQRTM